MIRYLRKEVENIQLNGKLTAAQIENNIKNLSQVTFEITESCNLSCKYCAYSKFYTIVKERTNFDIPFEYITTSYPQQSY